MTVQDNIDNLADNLLGTCKSLEQACNEAGYSQDDLTVNELSKLNDKVIECTECNWWTDSYDINEEGVCSECRNS